MAKPRLMKTVWVTVCGRKFASPLYAAVMLCVPTTRAFVAHWAWPLLTATAAQQALTPAVCEEALFRDRGWVPESHDHDTVFELAGVAA